MRLGPALLLGTFAAAAAALSPVTPRLAPDTRDAVLAGLTRAGMPEVAQNSVVIGITEALNVAPAARPIAYESTHAHLPWVKGQVTPLSDRCARAEARAWLPQEAEARAIRVEGTYCLVGPAEWRSTDQSVRRPAP